MKELSASRPPRPWPVACLLVALLLGAGAPASRAEGNAVTPAETGLAAAVAAGDHARALGLALELNRAAEAKHVETLYTVARLHGLLGHPDEALPRLKRAAAAGLLDVQEVRGDEAFAALREQERFQALTRRIWLAGHLWLLERPERDDYQKPEEVMRVLAFRPGERVADLGAGSGYFNFRLAART